ncbi:MAG: hypothetical protein AAF497_28440, partial [Planctomycetota bacterium]
ILIEGRTSNDANAAARDSMLEVWSDNRSIANRRSRMVGLGLAFGSRVFTDGSGDRLLGNKGTDWFFANSTDDDDDHVASSEFIDRP